MGIRVPSSSGTSRSVLMPDSMAFLATATWPAANTAVFARVTVPMARTYRYMLFREGVQSGNVQAGLVRLSGAGLTAYERVLHTGVIAAPAAGDERIDCGATALTPGDYALFLWADNTTITLPHATNVAWAATKTQAEVAALVGGVPASGSLEWTAGRLIAVGLEADV